MTGPTAPALDGQQHTALPWGMGLGRDTGAIGNNPRQMDDLRNVLFYDQALRQRGGLGDPVATDFTGSGGFHGTDVCHVAVFAATAQVIYVVMDASTRAVRIFTANLAGEAPVELASWATLNAEADTPPRFLTAESFGILLLAHDEPNVTHRFITQRYDPNAGTVVADVTADLDGTGAAPVKFRGVREYLGFMVGWGFGTASDPDRPEVLRISNGGDPTTYDQNSYFNVGAKGQPIVCCAPVQNALAVLKSVGWFRLDGTDGSNFTIIPVDPFTGCASARGVINVAGQCWWWSPAGPVRTVDGLITDPNWALGLDLSGPEPLDLPPRGSDAAIWTVFLADERHVLFACPNAQGTMTRGYVVSARDLGTPTPYWAYWTLNGVQLHGAIINAEQVSTIPPGTASDVTTSGSVGDATAAITVDWTNHDIVGDETVELWYKAAAGAWVKLKEFAYSTVAGTTSHTTFSGAPLVSGNYSIQIRMRRGTRYATGYESSNPDDWPLASFASGTIVVIPFPSAVMVTYSYVTGDITVGWTPGDVTLEGDVEVLSSDGTTSETFHFGAGVTSHVFPATGFGVSDYCRMWGQAIQAQVRHTLLPNLGGWAVAPVPAPAYWTGADISGLSVTLTGDRESVALGTDFDIEFTVPTGVSGDWDFEIGAGSNLGAYPSNAGCGATVPAGGGYVFPDIGAPELHPVFSGTFHDTEPSPVDVDHIPALPCATCQIVGQIIAMGEYSAFWRFAQAGTLSHRTASGGLNPFTGNLPGSNIGLDVGKACLA